MTVQGRGGGGAGFLGSGFGGGNEMRSSRGGGGGRTRSPIRRGRDDRERSPAGRTSRYTIEFHVLIVCSVSASVVEPEAEP
jgi:hypothetical protein